MERLPRDSDACSYPNTNTDTHAGPLGWAAASSYSPCLPIVDDLDCADIRAMDVAPVRVLGSDPYRLDGDNDGLGCE